MKQSVGKQKGMKIGKQEYIYNIYKLGKREIFIQNLKSTNAVDTYHNEKRAFYIIYI